MPCQAVYNKMALHPIPDELKDFEKIRKTKFLREFCLRK